MRSRESANSRRHRQTASSGRCRPCLEILEDRCAPAVGIFIENLSDDLNPAIPGFDSFDADSATIQPDQLHILHSLSGRWTIASNSAAPSPPPHLLLSPG